jgi:hypothetical protein
VRVGLKSKVLLPATLFMSLLKREAKTPALEAST